MSEIYLDAIEEQGFGLLPGPEQPPIKAQASIVKALQNNISAHGAEAYFDPSRVTLPPPKTAEDIHQTAASILPEPKPTLSPFDPDFASKHPLYSAIHLFQKVEEITAIGAEHFQQMSQQNLAESQSLEQKKMELISKEHDWMDAQKGWAICNTITSYVASAFSIVFGTAILPTAPVAGVLLISSGVAGIAGRILQDTHALRVLSEWMLDSEEEQRAFVQGIEISLYLLSSAIGIAGGITTYTSGVLTTAAGTLQETIKKTLAIASSTLNVVTQAGKSYIDYHLSHVRADLKDKSTETTLLDTDLQLDTAHLQEGIAK